MKGRGRGGRDMGIPLRHVKLFVYSPYNSNLH